MYNLFSVRTSGNEICGWDKNPHFKLIYVFMHTHNQELCKHVTHKPFMSLAY